MLQRGKANVVKINGDGEILWNYIYGIDDAETDSNACAQASFEANDIVEYDTCSEKPKLRLTGRANNFITQANGNINRVFMIDIRSDNGQFNWGKDYLAIDANDSALESVAWTIGKSGKCNEEIILVAERELNKIDHKTSCKVMAFNAVDANPIPLWTIYLDGPSQSLAEPHAIAFDMVERSNGNILLPVIYDCAHCQFASNNYGEAVVYEIKSVDGSIASPSPYAITNGSGTDQAHAYDLKVGITNTPDDGFAIVTSKAPVPYDSAFSTHSWNCSTDSGSSAILGYWNADACVRKYDASGILQWEKIFDIDDKAPASFPGDLKRQECMYSISNSPDGGLVIAGNCSRNFDDCYLVKLFDNCQNEQTYDIEPADISVSHVIPVSGLPSNPLTGSHKIRGAALPPVRQMVAKPLRLGIGIERLERHALRKRKVGEIFNLAFSTL